MADLQEAMEDAAAAPAEMTVDGITVRQQPIVSIIQALRMKASIEAASKNHKGLRFNKISPPGSS